MKNLLKALSEFQKHLPTIKRNGKGYNYKYSTFDDILSTCKPLLNQCGLVIVQPIKEAENGTFISTRLYHIESGEVLESEMMLPKIELSEVKKWNKSQQENVETTMYFGFDGMNKAQVVGSYITYFKRYAYCSLLGFTSDEDTDASGNLPQNEPLAEKQAVKVKPILSPKNKEKWIKGVTFAKQNGLQKLLTHYDLTPTDLKTMQDAIK